MKDLRNHNILVVGSSNTDMVIKTNHLPRPGETVLGGTFFMNPGGKGANQAVAVARLGGQVSSICKTGSDIFGHQSQQLFEEEGIDTSYIFSDPKNPSGVALITVDAHAENYIVCHIVYTQNFGHVGVNNCKNRIVYPSGFNLWCISLLDSSTVY